MVVRLTRGGTPRAQLSSTFVEISRDRSRSEARHPRDTSASPMTSILSSRLRAPTQENPGSSDSSTARMLDAHPGWRGSRCTLSPTMVNELSTPRSRSSVRISGMRSVRQSWANFPVYTSLKDLRSRESLPWGRTESGIIGDSNSVRPAAAGTRASRTARACSVWASMSRLPAATRLSRRMRSSGNPPPIYPYSVTYDHSRPSKVPRSTISRHISLPRTSKTSKSNAASSASKASAACPLSMASSASATGASWTVTPDRRRRGPLKRSRVSTALSCTCTWAPVRDRVSARDGNQIADPSMTLRLTSP